jgi:predicted aconitase with swiveling domain
MKSWGLAYSPASLDTPDFGRTIFSGDLSPMPIRLHCHRGIGPRVTGTALVAGDNFSARYDLDRTKGIFSRPSHKLAGLSYADRVLVLDTAKGGVATAWMLHEMAARGVVPRALIFNRVNPIVAQGAAFGGVALVDRFEGDVTEIFRTGDELRVDPAAGLVEILNRDC